VGAVILVWITRLVKQASPSHSKFKPRGYGGGVNSRGSAFFC